MNKLELKVPPVALVLITAALMWLAAQLVPGFDFTFPPRIFIAAGFVLIGIVVSALGVVHFRRLGTTVNPIAPQSASSLAVSGIYGRTRNPMYLGFLFVLLGWAVFLSNAFSFLFLPAFVAYMNRFQIRPEERALSQLFGEQFSDYTSKVRRWL